MKALKWSCAMHTPKTVPWIAPWTGETSERWWNIQPLECPRNPDTLTQELHIRGAGSIGATGRFVPLA